MSRLSDPSTPIQHPVQPSIQPSIQPRIQLDSNLRRWFTRNLGLWRSRRAYFFLDEDALHVDMMVRVEAYREPVEGDAAYRFTWWPEREFDFFERKPQYSRTGSMDAYLCGHQLQRSRGFYSDTAHRSQIRQVDEHELTFESRYQGWDILEHFRLVDQDRYRSRSIYSWRQGVLQLAEFHHEARVEAAGPPLPPADGP